MQIFFPGSQTTADMTLLFVEIQDFPRLFGKLWIDLCQTVGDIFMYRTFADAKLPGCLAYRCLVFNNIRSNFERSFFNIIFQKIPLHDCFFTIYARGF